MQDGGVHKELYAPVDVGVSLGPVVEDCLLLAGGVLGEGRFAERHTGEACIGDEVGETHVSGFSLRTACIEREKGTERVLKRRGSKKQSHNILAVAIAVKNLGAVHRDAWRQKPELGIRAPLPQ